MKRKINKILIANRGEIAVRVMKTCQEEGIRSVAVYSDIDRSAMHVRMANESYCIGHAPARDSYLNQNIILQIAHDSKCDAIHPGYGFLSENPGFADAVVENGLIFIGPSAKSIRLMGDKTAARRLVKSLGIPIVPGTTEPLKSVDDAAQIAEKIGYPVLLKAAGGGGGKGMRLVHSPSELASAFRASQSEAVSAFNDNRIYIEKYIQNPRHIEVQILADIFGNVIHLGERECSIQRRHQKIIEESPSTFIDPEIRGNLTLAATSIVQKSGYTNAGTLEFIFDADKNFYFLEMNTRLQVEHPVTEMRVGFDLVREQIRIAGGAPITYRQEEIKFTGHAIECRIYAEDPLSNFVPSTGIIRSLKSPCGFGIREDRGVEEKNEISPYYDPLLSKLVTWGTTRGDAIGRMLAALTNYEIHGVRNNLAFCHWAINHPNFRSGDIDTNFVDKHFKPDLLAKIPCKITDMGGAVALSQYSRFVKPGSNAATPNSFSKWKEKRKEYLR